MTEKVIHTQRIENADDLCLFLNNLLINVSIVKGVGVVYVQNQEGFDFTEARLIEEILTDGSVVYNIQLS